ncbi:helix-turn-helix domain-containing protein [Lawsonella clevelandensis]|uniref:helix-turn-helix domain-containing protein n=1 Tax=Lawsonella clevelandensis TaxID=1528099 RepID=UPI0023F3F559|nr:helix-turn-helix domain-containing protein [Lawsonella clevelandensis]
MTVSNTSISPQFISVSDAATLLSLSTKSVHRMINAGELTGYYPRPRALRVSVSELDALMKRNATRKVA